MENNEVLVKVSTYAKQNKVSPTTIINWANKGLVYIEMIDGMKFVNINKSKKERLCLDS